MRACVFLVFLAVAHTWPLASAPHRLSLNHHADAQLNAWIVSWVAHALPTEPLPLWQSNIFQPRERALSFSEPLIVPAIAGAPVFWLTGSAVLTFNLLRDEPEPVLLAEMPFYPPDGVFQNGEYVLNATAHGRPVMNGYSGATPVRHTSWSISRNLAARLPMWPGRCKVTRICA